jgi:hypothetical protein
MEHLLKHYKCIKDGLFIETNQPIIHQYKWSNEKQAGDEKKYKEDFN